MIYTCIVADYIIQLHQMKLDNILQDQQYSHRTQISLSDAMYRQLIVEKGSKSLAEHIRQMIIQVWHWQESKKESKDQLLKILDQPMPGKTPTIKNLLAWQQSIRVERAI